MDKSSNNKSKNSGTTVRGELCYAPHDNSISHYVHVSGIDGAEGVEPSVPIDVLEELDMDDLPPIIQRLVLEKIRDNSQDNEGCRENKKNYVNK